MRQVFILLVFTCFALISAGQINLPLPYEIKTDTPVNIVLDDSYWQMMEDAAGELTIDQVSQSSLAEKFHSNTTKNKQLDYSIKAYWIRYRFINRMSHEARITIRKEVSYADL